MENAAYHTEAQRDDQYLLFKALCIPQSETTITTGVRFLSAQV